MKSHSISLRALLMSSAAVSSRKQHLQGSFLLFVLLSGTLQIFTSACLSQTAPDGATPLSKQWESRARSSMATGLIGKDEHGTAPTGLQEADGFHASSKEDCCTTTTCSSSRIANAAELQQRETAATNVAELREATATEQQRQEEEEATCELMASSPKSLSSCTQSPRSLMETTLAQKKSRRKRFRNRRMLGPNQVCTNKDVSIFQGQVGFSGIPQYIVQIVNTCMSDCAPSDIHVYCGWFASALLVNPNVFSRIAFNDCLVNGGRPLSQGEMIRFEYANSFMYPMRFKSASFYGCTNKDISITQSQLGSAAGIPQYSVQIVNTCISDCAPTNIHVYCGWFASSPPPNPNTFTRLAYNDCLVNGGCPLAQGSMVEFQYANSFMYTLSFRSANFCR